MRVLLDLNIWIDIAGRRSNFPESRKLYKDLEAAHHEICLSLGSYTTLYYLLGNLISKDAALAFCSSIRQRSVRLLPFTVESVGLAHKLQFSDHEDACVAASAVIYDCDFIVTRNTKHFKSSPIKAMTPIEFSKKILEANKQK